MANRSLSSRAGQSRVSFSLRVDEFRSHPIAGIHDAKVGSGYVSAEELVAHLDLDKWLEVNPRVPNRNAKNVLTGHVIKGIQETLDEGPEDFALKNQGLFLLVEKMEHERKTGGVGLLTVTLSDNERHGLCNGGHTYAAIRDYAERNGGECRENLRQAYVRLHIFEGISADKVTAMAEGLNRSKQVDDPSLADLDGYFDEMREVMRGKPGANQIAYHQGHEGAYYITEIIRALMFFNCARYDNRKHPYTLYRQQKAMVRQFKDDYDAKPSSVHLTIPKLPEILVLSDKIAQCVPSECAKLTQPFTMGRMKADAKTRAGSKEHKDTPLYWFAETMDCRVPSGWLMPMLAAFRANVEWNLDEGVFRWREPLDEVLDAVKGDLVRICVQEYRDNKVKPDEMARKASVYEQCYDKVDRHLAQLELERLRGATAHTNA